MTGNHARVSRVTLTRVEHEVGLGVEGDPVRTWIELHDDRGRLVAWWDTLEGRGEVRTMPSEEPTR